MNLPPLLTIDDRASHSAIQVDILQNPGEAIKTTLLRDRVREKREERTKSLLVWSTNCFGIVWLALKAQACYHIDD